MTDYVIVGAGSAGCVLAARLTEDPDVSVLLLEAGGPDTAPELHVPAMFPVVFKSSLDWDLLGEPEPGLGGRRLYLPRGRVIGGSGSINAMIYLRGHRADFDGWAADGCTGWSYDEVLPYFKRSEDNERGESAFHGVGGPLSVSDSRSMSRFTEFTYFGTWTPASRERLPAPRPGVSAPRPPMMPRCANAAPGIMVRNTSIVRARTAIIGLLPRKTSVPANRRHGRWRPNCSAAY